jgi:hypothetical protein
MRSVQEMVQAQLFELQDLKYKTFQCKLMPTVNPETVIGVRTRICASSPGRFPKRRRPQILFTSCRTRIMKKITCTAF